MKKYIGIIILTTILIALLITKLLIKQNLEYKITGVLLEILENENSYIYKIYDNDEIELKSNKKLNLELGDIYDFSFNENEITQARHSLYIENDKVIDIKENKIILKNNIIEKDTKLINIIKNDNNINISNLKLEKDMEILVYKKNNKVINIYKKTNQNG